MGLNGAVDSGRATVAGKGFDHIVIAHSDLPFARDLAGVASVGHDHDRPRPGSRWHQRARAAGRLVRCTRATGPTRSAPTSRRAGDLERPPFRVEVRRDPYLAARRRHARRSAPSRMLHEELPPWLQTILASRP